MPFTTKPPIALLTRISATAWLVGLLGSGLPLVASAQTSPLPEALKALQQAHGVKVLGPIPAVGGLQAWAGVQQGTPLALYLTPDGQHVITGVMLDSKGQEVNRALLEQTVRPQTDRATWTSLETSHWVPDGNAQAERVVYVFTDPNCPYCKKLWQDARPWVQAGRVQLRHVMVGQLREDSAAKAAAVLESSTPDVALTAMVQGAKPAAHKVSAAAQSKLEHNHQLMAELGLRGTPAVFWRDSQSALHKLRGAPRDMASVLGPKP